MRWIMRLIRLFGDVMKFQGEDRVSANWIQDHAQRLRDTHEGPCIDWETAPAAFETVRQQNQHGFDRPL